MPKKFKRCVPTISQASGATVPAAFDPVHARLGRLIFLVLVSLGAAAISRSPETVIADPEREACEEDKPRDPNRAIEARDLGEDGQALVQDDLFSRKCPNNLKDPEFPKVLSFVGVLCWDSSNCSF